jgi:hypothetical protein
MTSNRTKQRTAEDGIRAIESMIRDPWPKNQYHCMDGSSIGRIVAYLDEQGFDVESTDDEGRSVMFGPEVAVEKNIFYWIGSQWLADMLRTGIEQGRFHFRPTEFLVAAIDGGRMPQAKVATQMRSYKEPRWLPTVLWLGRYEDWTEDRYRS